MEDFSETKVVYAVTHPTLKTIVHVLTITLMTTHDHHMCIGGWVGQYNCTYPMSVNTHHHHHTYIGERVGEYNCMC